MAATEKVSRTARSIARAEITAAILAEARQQLATVGPAGLSVRAVAREVGMVSSAVYRYFPSRDDLLTELLVQAYTEVGTALEAADAQRDRTDLAGRWSTLAHTLRTWSLQHPHDYALLYGSPVPGYAAPQATIEPAGRVTGVLLRLLQDAPSESAAGPVDPGLHAALAGVREFAGDLPDAVVLRGLNAWAGLIGTLTLELFGHLHRGVLDYDTFFDATVRRISPV